MKEKHYIIIIIVLIFAILFVPLIINNKVKSDEIWWEPYQIQDGSYIRIIHSHDCNAKKPIIAWNKQCKIIHFHKEKIDVYDFCINEDEANMLNFISKKNIKYAMERQWSYAEDETDYNKCKWNENMWDTTLRVYEVAYSMLNDKLITQHDDGMILADYSLKTMHSR